MHLDKAHSLPGTFTEHTKYRETPPNTHKDFGQSMRFNTHSTFEHTYANLGPSKSTISWATFGPPART